MNAQTQKIFGFTVKEYLGETLGEYFQYLDESSIACSDSDGEIFDVQCTLNVPDSVCDDEIIQALTVNYYAGHAGGRFFRSGVFFEQPKNDGFHTITVTICDGYDV